MKSQTLSTMPKFFAVPPSLDWSTKTIEMASSQ
jgi:hypothetical protein